VRASIAIDLGSISSSNEIQLYIKTDFPAPAKKSAKHEGGRTDAAANQGAWWLPILYPIAELWGFEKPATGITNGSLPDIFVSGSEIP